MIQEEALDRAFPDTPAPGRDALVAQDGFDILDKATAVESFGGMTRDEVESLVGKGPRGEQWLWGLEELEVLEPAALRYYVKPFLRRLLTIKLAEEDDFSFFLASHLTHALERHGPELFSTDQREFLRDLAGWMCGQIEGSDAWAVAHRGHYERLVALLPR